MIDLDACIEQLRNCDVLDENEVRVLCEMAKEILVRAAGVRSRARARAARVGERARAARARARTTEISPASRFERSRGT